MAGLLNFIRRKSNHELIFWLLDRLAAFFERLAALTTDPVLKLYMPNAMVVCIYKDVSRDIEIWVGEVANYIPRSEWRKIVLILQELQTATAMFFWTKTERLFLSPISPATSSNFVFTP
jgi:hypothetical protein